MSLGNEDEWGTTALQVLGWLTLLGALISSIALMTYSPASYPSFSERRPFFFEGLLFGLFGLLEGGLIFGVRSYMTAQRRFASNLGRSLGKIETKLEKIERDLSSIPASSEEMQNKSDRSEEHDSNKETDNKSSGSSSLYFGGRSLLAEGIEHNKRKKAEEEGNSP